MTTNRDRDSDAPKSHRGFASMDIEKQREIASKGGKAAHAQGRAHEFSPEEARSLVASLQSGWQRGRESDVPDGEPADAAQGAGRQDSEAPRGEETLWMSRDWPDQASS